MGKWEKGRNDKGLEKGGEYLSFFQLHRSRALFEMKSKVNLNFVGGRVKGAENLSEKLV